MVTCTPTPPSARRRTSSPVESAPVQSVEYEIVHQISGRVRFRIPRLGHDAKFARRLNDRVGALNEIRQVRVNQTGLSMVVEFQENTAHANDAGSGASEHARSPVIPALIECIRISANAQSAVEIPSLPETAPKATPITHLPRPQDALVSEADAETKRGLPPFENPIRYVQQLGIPTLALGLTGAAALGVAIPGIVLGAAVLAATVPHAQRAWQGIREEKRLTVEILDVTASVLLVAQSSFLPPAIMMGIIEVAEVVRAWTARRGRQAGFDLLLPQDYQVLVERENGQEYVAAQSIEPEDIIFVSGGDLLPVDGIVLRGSARIDQQPLTGDSEAVTRQEGDVVYAATRVLDGTLRIMATHVGTDTLAAATLALMDAVPKRDSRGSNFARKTGNPAVVPTLAIGSAVGVASNSLARATSIVSLDFGLGMRVSTPIALLSAQAHGKSEGILFRSGRAIEKLGQSDIILFSPNLPRGQTKLLRKTLRELKIETGELHAQLLPKQAAEVVREFQQSGKTVAVVGDGINHAVAMAQADVSVALGMARDVVRETADVVLLQNELQDLLTAIAISQHALRVLKQNQKIVVAGNTAGIAYGVLTVLSPIAGILVNNGITMVAALNSLRRSDTRNRTTAAKASKNTAKQRTLKPAGEAV